MAKQSEGQPHTHNFLNQPQPFHDLIKVASASHSLLLYIKGFKVFNRDVHYNMDTNPKILEVLPVIGQQVTARPITEQYHKLLFSYS